MDHVAALVYEKIQFVGIAESRKLTEVPGFTCVIGPLPSQQKVLLSIISTLPHYGLIFIKHFLLSTQVRLKVLRHKSWISLRALSDAHHNVMSHSLQRVPASVRGVLPRMSFLSHHVIERTLLECLYVVLNKISNSSKRSHQFSRCKLLKIIRTDFSLRCSPASF